MRLSFILSLICITVLSIVLAVILGSALSKHYRNAITVQIACVYILFDLLMFLATYFYNKDYVNYTVIVIICAFIYNIKEISKQLYDYFSTR